MKNKQILWALVFGAMLAVTGCGDDSSSTGSGGSSGSGGSAGTGGSAGGDFCTSLCEACGGGQADCLQACDLGFGSIPPEFLDSCPSELDTLTSCFAANDCDGDVCDAEITAWATCITMNIQP